MATAATIKKNIAKLEAALKSKATPKSLKSKLEVQLVKSKAELSGINKGTKPKTSTTKSTQTALQKLKDMVKKNKKLKTYKGAGVDLEKDADRPALPIGRRTAKKSGKTYYEYRANRIDVKQPPKRYPKLEKGGYMADGGEVSEQEAKEKLIKLRNEQELNFSIGNHGLIFMSLKNGNKKSYDNYKKAYEHYLETKGGYMADGGEVGFDEDIKETKRLITSFIKKYGHIFPMNEINFIKNLEAQDYLGYGASSYNYYTVTSNIEDKLAIDETKPKYASLWLKSDINPNGISGKDDVARTYTIHLEIKGRKRLSQRSYDEDGLFFKIYDYGRTIAEVLEKVEDKMYQLETKIRKYDLRFFEVLEKGGYMAKGGTIKNQYEGKTAEKVWGQWTEEQRSHFLLDHSELLDKDRLENNLGYSRTIQKDKKYEDLTPHTKRVLESHVRSGQYAKGGYFAKGGLTEHGLKVGDTIVDDMFWDKSVKVLNSKTGYAVVKIETGERKEMKAMGGEMHRTQE